MPARVGSQDVRKGGRTEGPSRAGGGGGAMPARDGALHVQRAMGLDIILRPGSMLCQGRPARNGSPTWGLPFCMDGAPLHA